ncbi:hypothetical protein PCCS19_35490 [Paenibacillus sp. CCS19]|nr:hypothetical protein PCCS19_35490 [Paenibacillus cellulosilyticus]
MQADSLTCPKCCKTHYTSLNRVKSCHNRLFKAEEAFIRADMRLYAPLQLSAAIYSEHRFPYD